MKSMRTWRFAVITALLAAVVSIVILNIVMMPDSVELLGNLTYRMQLDLAVGILICGIITVLTHAITNLLPARPLQH